MIVQHDDRVMSLFEIAVELEPSRRARFLEHACSDQNQRRKLEAMLSVDRKSTRSILAPGRAVHHGAEVGISARAQEDGDTVHTAPPIDWLRKPPPQPDEPPTPEPRKCKSTVQSAEPESSIADEAVHLIRPGIHIQHYELISEIGRGGMGAVYKARDTKLGRRVAIKFLHTDDSRLTERFVLEARATARCSHENIVIIHDVSHYQAVPYMVLEHLKGQPLSKLIGDERIPPARAVQRSVVCSRRRATMRSVV